jgi:hypothetical protein
VPGAAPLARDGPPASSPSLASRSTSTATSWGSRQSASP